MATDPGWRELVGRPVRMEEARRIANAQRRVHGGTELPHRTATRLRRAIAISPATVPHLWRPNA